MSSSDSETELSNTPPNIIQLAANTTKNLLPEKSRERYETVYQKNQEKDMAVYQQWTGVQQTTVNCNCMSVAITTTAATRFYGQPQFGPLHREVDLFIRGLRAMEGDPLPVVSRDEVLGTIVRRRNGMTPGDNGIANTALKKLPSNNGMTPGDNGIANTALKKLPSNAIDIMV
ncbi:hypothetical protein QE152_g15822 [Popillia japonica]|uniref:Uncharacterized protein n=1 Tax=Popillia japonica TaxID=7064 RepID=A0AAW1L4G8_POPJA